MSYQIAPLFQHSAALHTHMQMRIKAKVYFAANGWCGKLVTVGRAVLIAMYDCCIWIWTSCFKYLYILRVSTNNRNYILSGYWIVSRGINCHVPIMHWKETCVSFRPGVQKFQSWALSLSCALAAAPPAWKWRTSKSKRQTFTQPKSRLVHHLLPSPHVYNSWILNSVPCDLFRLSFTKGHFPKLAECAHFHYENVDFGTIQVRS